MRWHALPLALIVFGAVDRAAGDPAPRDFALRARVVDAAGKPVEGAEVRAYAAFSLVRAFAGSRDPMDIGLPKETALGKTAADGGVTIGGLESERYVLRATAPGRGLGLLESAVAAEGGGPEVVVTMPESVAVEGDVVDLDGKGIAGATVAFGPAEGLDLSEVESGIGRIVGTTDPAGRFRLEGVPATRTPPRPEAWLDGQMLHVRASPTVRISRTYGEKPNRRLRVTVGGRCVVAGTASTRGEAKAVPDARVFVVVHEVTEEAATSAVVFATSSRVDGQLRIEGVPRGWLFGGEAHTAARYAGDLTYDVPEVADKQTTRMRAELDRTLTVTGRVVDAQGKPVAGAEIVDWKGDVGETSATSDAEGRYLISGIDRWRDIGPPGKERIGSPLVLVCRAPGLVVAHHSESVRLQLESMRASAATEIAHDIVLQPAASISGRVIGLDGKPAAGVRVACAGEDQKASELWFDVVTGTDGSFVLPGLDAGAIVVEAGEVGPRGSALQRVVLAVGEKKAGVELRLAAAR